MSGFKLRQWQIDAIDSVVNVAQTGSDRALVYACPGSGKTYGGLSIAAALGKHAGKGPKIIVLTPNLAIKTQWIDRAATIGLRLLPLKSGDDLRQGGLSLEECGFILSYQQAIHLRHSLKQFCEAERPIAILDEVHHTAGPKVDRDGNAWGHAVEFALSSASFKLCTTGTPFREGDNPISFVRYGADGAAVALVRYTYEQAIKDGVCRPIEFAMFEGNVRWVDRRGQAISACFGDKLNKSRQAQRLRAALSTDGGHPRTLLAAANERLQEIRAGSREVDRRAAGLAVAIDTEHANEIATEIAAITGRKPVVVHSKIDEAQDLIDRFRDGDDEWIVGINMLSEGVDIPRLRVGVYASNVRAALYFHQFAGRLARVMESRDERSFVFMPADSELESIALEIEKYRAHALGEEFQPRLRRVGGGGSGKPRDELEVLGSDGEHAATALHGGKIPVSYQKAHRDRIVAFRLLDPSRQSMSDGQILKIMIDLGVIPPPEAV